MVAKPKPRKNKAPKKSGNSLITNRAPDEEAKEAPVTGPTVYEGGTTIGYRDGENCVETKRFLYGKKLPKGWADTPAKLKNHTTNKDTIFNKVD